MNVNAAMTEEKSTLEAIVATEGNLPDVVASLEMLTVTSTSCESESLSPNKMVLRKRVPKMKSEDTEVRNRRCSMRPKKRSVSEMDSEENVKEYYLDKSITKKANNLETIFEEPDEALTNEIARSMSTKRFKRMIQFQSQPSDSKIRKRRAKVKKIFGSKFLMKHRQTSMQMLINKLNMIRPESLVRITEDA